MVIFKWWYLQLKIRTSHVFWSPLNSYDLNTRCPKSGFIWKLFEVQYSNGNVTDLANIIWILPTGIPRIYFINVGRWRQNLVKMFGCQNLTNFCKDFADLKVKKKFGLVVLITARHPWGWVQIQGKAKNYLSTSSLIWPSYP